jgi:hypothetical protein
MSTRLPIPIGTIQLCQKARALLLNVGVNLIIDWFKIHSLADTKASIGRAVTISLIHHTTFSLGNS